MFNTILKSYSHSRSSSNDDKRGTHRARHRILRCPGVKNKTAATVHKTRTNDRRISSLPPCWPAWRSNELGGRPLGDYFGSGRIATAAARTGDLQLDLIAGHGAGV